MMSELPSSDLLTDAEIENALAELTGWSRDGNALVIGWRFSDFEAAMSFMIEASPCMRAINHHAEWSNVYNRVAARLTTHDSGGISALDVHLAKAMSEVASDAAATVEAPN